PPCRRDGDGSDDRLSGRPGDARARRRQGWRTPARRPRDGTRGAVALSCSAGLAALHLPQRLVDQPLVVLPRNVALQDFRGDLDREVDRFGADLLNRPRGLELNLPFGAAHDRLGVATRLLFDLLSEPLAIRATPRENLLGVGMRPVDDLRRLLLDAL